MSTPAPAPLALERLQSRPLFEAEPPPELYHYTDLDGVAGILNSRSLYLSKISTLNDTSEITLAVQLFKALASEAVGQIDRDEAALLRLAADRLDHFRRTNICVGSFCEEQDQLNQWRSYGNDGRGIAVGFHTGELAAAAREHAVRLVRCIYEPEEHVQITKDLGALLLNAFRGERTRDAERLQEVVLQFISTFLLIAPVLKDHHFAQEREWRVVSLPRAHDDHRLTAVLTGNIASVKFVMPLCHDGERDSRIISSLVIGPTQDPENIADAVDVLARHHGFRIPDIRFSRIPYRPKR